MTTDDINKFGSDELKILVEDLRKQRVALDKKEDTIKKREEELKEKLSKASKMTADEAKKILLEEVDKDLKEEVAKRIRRAEERVRQEAKEKALEILADAMRHGATQYTAEFTVSSVEVPNEEVKGRIIGAQGRNIRAFEKETGV